MFGQFLATPTGINQWAATSRDGAELHLYGCPFGTGYGFCPRTSVLVPPSYCLSPLAFPLSPLAFVRHCSPNNYVDRTASPAHMQGQVIGVCADQAHKVIHVSHLLTIYVGDDVSLS